MDAHRRDVREESKTLLVNEGGCLVALAAEFRMNDRVRVINPQTGESVDGRIAWQSSEPLNGRWSYGIAFLEIRESFWGLTVFPE
jgi:hypothetical protein